MSVILKNQTQSDIYVVGVDTVPASGQLVVDPASYRQLSISNVFQFIWDGSLVVNDGSQDISDKVTAQMLCLGNATRIVQEDPDTKGVLITQKLGPENSYEQAFETEWKTSTLDSIHEKDIDNQDIGWSSIKFFELINGAEFEMQNPTQNDLDTKCVRTDLIWAPDEDYWVKSGKVGHTEALNDNLYVWARGSDGLANLVFVEGGMNLRFLGAKEKMGVDGASSTHMPQFYDHPQYGQLPANVIRVVARHPAGLKHSLQLLMGIFRLKS